MIMFKKRKDIGITVVRERNVSMKHFLIVIICFIGVFIWMNVDVEMGKKMASGYELEKFGQGIFNYIRTVTSYIEVYLRI